MKFIIDAQLPPSLAQWIMRHGHDAQHVQDLGLRDADDHEIRAAARKLGAIVMTKDRDFAPPASGLAIVWVRTGNVPNQVLFERIESAWPKVIEHLADGAEVIEIR